MTNIDSFLRQCVYYPCSALHEVPVKILSKRFRRFFYADYSVERAQFEKFIEEDGFKGYRLSATDELTAEFVFGMSWEGVRQKHCNTLSRLHFEWSEPFVVLSRFERASDLADDHGPASFEFMFARCEAIATFISTFSRRNIAPKCLAHIRSGIGLGGNFSDYPQELSRVLLANSGGLPGFMLYDQTGSSSNCGDYLDLIEKYESVERWGRPDGDHLILAKCIT